MTISRKDPDRTRKSSLNRSPQDVEQRSWLSVPKRLVYRTPASVIEETGLRDEQGRLLEKEIYTCRHHWTLLLRALLIPVGMLLIFAALAYYRAVGGEFLDLNVVPVGEIDMMNRLLLFAVFIVGCVWLFLSLATSTRRNGMAMLIILGVLLVGLFYFRYQGGRVFYINQNPLIDRSFDTFNLVLIGLAVFSALAVAYVFFDWLNDFLILTDQRVIYDDEKLFVRREQDQIIIEDIQNVLVDTGENSPLGYVQHHLKFGKVVIQSASFRQDIVFQGASNPKEMQRQIMNEVKKVQDNWKKADFNKMIQKITNTAPPSAAPTQPVKRSSTARFLAQFFPENPERKDDGTITWRPHWIFAVIELLRPIGAFLLVIVALVVSAQIGLLPVNLFGWFGVILLFCIVGFVGWVLWQIEDYRNDLYILTSSQVIDIEQVPFGPENRRTASLGALQNVQLKTTFIGRYIGYGDVEMETAGGKTDSKFTFHGVPQPSEVVALINKYRSEFKRGERERSLNETMALLKEYHNFVQQQQQGRVEGQ
ncbi:MAG: PH domain-containing protein [Chloroflexaceae bacterium]